MLSSSSDLGPPCPSACTSFSARPPTPSARPPTRPWVRGFLAVQYYLLPPQEKKPTDAAARTAHRTPPPAPRTGRRDLTSRHHDLSSHLQLRRIRLHRASHPFRKPHPPPRPPPLAGTERSSGGQRAGACGLRRVLLHRVTAPSSSTAPPPLSREASIDAASHPALAVLCGQARLAEEGTGAADSLPLRPASLSLRTEQGPRGRSRGGSASSFPPPTAVVSHSSFSFIFVHIQCRRRRPCRWRGAAENPAPGASQLGAPHVAGRREAATLCPTAAAVA
jgi:hypothetical protein